MRYFEAFPLVQYSFDDSKQPILLTHILRRFSFQEKIKSIVAMWNAYTIREGEQPEDLAFRFYGDPNLHWVILLFNNVIDPMADWPMSSDVLEKEITRRYGTNELGVHHYEKDGRVVPGNVPGASLITNREFLTRTNDGLRQIKVPQKVHIRAIKEELERVLKETR